MCSWELPPEFMHHFRIFSGCADHLQWRSHVASCCCSATPSCPHLCCPMDCSMPGFPVLHYSLEFAQTHVYWVQPSRPLSSPPLPSFSLSQPASGSFPKIQLFTSGGAKYWSFSFSISASKEYSGLTFLRIDWFDLAVQGTLKSLLEYHTVQGRQFFSTQPFLLSSSHICMWLLGKP